MMEILHYISPCEANGFSMFIKVVNSVMQDIMFRSGFRDHPQQSGNRCVNRLVECLIS